MLLSNTQSRLEGRADAGENCDKEDNWAIKGTYFAV